MNMTKTTIFAIKRYKLHLLQLQPSGHISHKNPNQFLEAVSDEYCHLLGRIAGNSDDCVDLDKEHQQEIINKTKKQELPETKT